MEKNAGPTSNSDCGYAAREKPGNVSAILHMGKIRNLTHDRFQWAFLQIKQLLDLHRSGEILDRLGKLPEDLRQTYDEIYNRMKDHEKEIADRAFQWVMCAVEPLQTKELLPAICQDENSDTLAPLDGLDEDLVLEYCHNLLVIDPVRKVWVPSHLSVIEYVENRWSLSQANCLVSSICLLVLQRTVLYSREKSWCRKSNKKNPNDYWASENPKPVEEEDTSEEDSSSTGITSSIGEEVQNAPTGTILTSSIDPSDPLHKKDFKYLASYARMSCMFHVQKSALAVNKQRVSTLLHEFLGHPSESSAAYRCWLKMVKVDYKRSKMTVSRRNVWNLEPKDIAPDSAASFVYCLFDLAINLPDWHNFEWIKLEQRTIHGDSCLELAVIGGAFHTCRELIKHGASVNDQTESYNGSALATATYEGNREVVEYLVKKGGADINLQLQFGEYGSALAAAAKGYKNKEVVEFLVKEGGADVNMQLQCGKYGSALAAAAEGYKNKEVVEFLVKEGGADVNMQLQCGKYGSALAAAAEGYKNKEVVEFLVKEGGADVNMQLQCGEYGSALAAAAVWGYQEVVEFLVKEGGADVNMQLQYGKYGSALAAAAGAAGAYGRMGAVVFLVKKGRADVNMQLQHGEYGSALAAAVAAPIAAEDDDEDDDDEDDYDEEDDEEDDEDDEDEEDDEDDDEEDDEEDDWWVIEQVVEFLVKEGGAEINMQLEHGKYANALDAAEKNGRSKIAQLLIQLGAKRPEEQHMVLEEEKSFDTNVG
jgi:ankyrin repeat protein